MLVGAALAINTPFGYFRAKSRKFSVAWFLYIHLPIPFLFVLRRLAGFGIEFVPIIAVGAILGQIVGGRFNNPKVSCNER